MHVLAALAAAAALMPGFTKSAVGPDGGAVLTGTFPGGARPGYVYLPPHFDTARRYPVVYLLHGMPGSPSEYLAGASLVSFADSAIASGRVLPFIAVIPAAGTSTKYNGEWAGIWEHHVVRRVVPFVDTWLPTQPDSRGRVIAGLSAGGYGAVDIALRNPGVFGIVESWGGYFTPLRDGPFRHAARSVLDANDPTKLIARAAPLLRKDRTRFFLSTGPGHSHWFTPEATVAFASELRQAGLRPALRLYPTAEREWSRQLAAGLAWAFGA
jgi:enterochelin esterase-like enzyme